MKNPSGKSLFFLAESILLRHKGDWNKTNKIKTRNETSWIVCGKDKIYFDSEDIFLISRFTWHIRKNKKHKYAYATAYLYKKKGCIAMHRIISGFRSGLVDHKNGNGLDNRKLNLRICNYIQNAYNRQKPKGKFKGVKKNKTDLYAV